MQRRRQQMEERASLRFDDVLAEIEAAAADVDVLGFLSAFSFHEQLRDQSGVGEWGEIDHISQFHLELLQAVLLRRSSLRGTPAEPQTFLTVRNALLALTHLDPVEDRREGRNTGGPASERSPQWALDAIRADQAIVRNWAVPSAVERLIRETWAPIDDDVEAALGLRMGDVARFLFAVAVEIEDRLVGHHRRLRALYEAHDGPTMVKRIANTFPLLCDQPDYDDRVGEIAVASGAELAVRAHVLADRSLATASVFTLEKALELYPRPVAPAVLEAALASWSLTAGELATVPTDELHHSNPVWMRPFVRLSGDRFALFVVATIQSFAIQLVEDLVDAHPQLIARYQKQRARYLERRARDLFTEAFPAGEVIAGAGFRPPSAVSEHENDLLVVIDDTALLIELKSNRVPRAARRGGRLSVEDAIERLIVEPAQQAAAFEAYLRAHGPRPSLLLDGKTHTVDMRLVTHYVRLTITYENLGLWAQPLALKNAGLLAVDANVSRPLLLTDAAEIFDLLPSQATRIDFLERRDWLDRGVRWVGDDQDLLALYLHNHLRVPEPPADMVMWMSHHSLELQPYFVAREKGWPLRKPALELTSLWRDILNRIEERSLEKWLQPCRTLLSISPPSQRGFARNAVDLTRRIRSGASLGELVILQSGSIEDAAICGFAYLPESADRHLAIIRRSVEEVLSAPGAPHHLLVLGFVPGRRMPQQIFTTERRGVGADLFGS